MKKAAVLMFAVLIQMIASADNQVCNLAFQGVPSTVIAAPTLMISAVQRLAELSPARLQFQKMYFTLPQGGMSFERSASSIQLADGKQIDLQWDTVLTYGQLQGEREPQFHRTLTGSLALHYEDEISNFNQSIPVHLDRRTYDSTSGVEIRSDHYEGVITLPDQPSQLITIRMESRQEEIRGNPRRQWVPTGLVEITVEALPASH